MKTQILKIYSAFFGFNSNYILRDVIVNNGAFLKKNKFSIKGKNNCITVNANTRFEYNSIYIVGENNKIVIEDNSRIIQSKFWIEGNNNLIYIGKNFKSGGPIVFAAMEGTKIEIGDNNLFSFDIEMRTSDGHSIFDSEGKRINSAKDIKIGNSNWIGKKVTFLKGAEIGNNNVVGYGSIVTKKIVLDNSLIVGVPAECKRTNIEWSYKMI